MTAKEFYQASAKSFKKIYDLERFFIFTIFDKRNQFFGQTFLIKVLRQLHFDCISQKQRACRPKILILNSETGLIGNLLRGGRTAASYGGFVHQAFESKGNDLYIKGIVILLVPITCVLLMFLPIFIALSRIF